MLRGVEYLSRNLSDLRLSAPGLGIWSGVFYYLSKPVLRMIEWKLLDSKNRLKDILGGDLACLYLGQFPTFSNLSDSEVFSFPSYDFRLPTKILASISQERVFSSVIQFRDMKGTDLITGVATSLEKHLMSPSPDFCSTGHGAPLLPFWLLWHWSLNSTLIS